MPSTARRRDALILAGPALATIVAFMLVPMALALVTSVLTPSPYGGVTPPLTVSSYVRFVYDRDLDDKLVFDATYLRIFARSFVLAAVTTALCLVASLPLAWYVATRAPRRRRILVLLITIPFWTNLLIRIYCWVLLLRDEGLVNHLLMGLGVIHAPVGFLYTDGAILMGLVYANLPFMALPIYAALEKLDARLVEAAYDLYATRNAVFRTLILPMARPGVAAGILLVFVPSLGAFVAPDILGGGRRLMIGSLIQQQFSTGRDWSFGAALSMILMAFVLGALVWNALRRRRRGALV